MLGISWPVLKSRVFTRSESRRLGFAPSEQPKHSARKCGEAGEDEAQLVAGATHERVDDVADGAFEVVSLEPPVGALTPLGGT